ncbi:MAG: ABC transporter ATP-binding protein [Spirochaetaceae bacterium]|nr:ABC transporter ATP-binding protein [Spirochaetaceae bacterium]
MSKVEINNVSLEFRDAAKSFLALDGVNLNIENGEFVCIIGPSGCGKSTLISLLAGLNFPTRGEVRIDGAVVRGSGTDRGMVFQHYSLFPWLTAKKNVYFGIKQAKLFKDKKLIEERALEYLKRVNLEEYADKYPYQLSGGMQQRVAIARTLAMDTEILLLDEPFGAIDPKNRLALQGLTIKLCKKNENRKAVLFVTHDIDEAIILADRIVFMEPKKIKEEIPVGFPPDLTREEIIASPKYTEVRTHLMSLFLQDVGNRIGEEVVL